MSAALPPTAVGKPIEVWFQDEARIGQQGTLNLSGMEAALNAYQKPSGPPVPGIEQYIDANKTHFTNAFPNVVLSPMSIDIMEGSSTATTSVDDTGGGSPINVRSPYIGMNWLIQVTGLFPSRN